MIIYKWQNLIIKKVNSFFINGHERTLLAKKNIVISLLLKGVSIATGLLLVPMTIDYVSPSQYGIWLTLSSLIGWFYFLDIGLANGLKNKLAAANALNDVTNSKVYISTTYAILTIISVVIFLLFFVANIFLDWNKILNVKNSNVGNLNLIALIVLGAFCAQFVLQIISSIFTAFHSVYKISLLTCIGQLGCLITIFILTKKTSGSLLDLVIILTGIPIIVQFVASIWYFNTTYLKFSPSFKLVNLKYAKSLLSVGGAFFFVQIGSLLLFQTDNIIVIQIFGPNDVTIFNISYKLFSIISMIFTIIMNPFWPAFTDAYTKKDIVWIKTIFAKMYRYFFILSIVSFVLLFISPHIFRLWLGKEIVIPFGLSLAMVLYVLGVCWMTIHCYLLNGIGKIRLQLYLYVVSTVINIPMAIFFAKKIGLVGVTISNILILILMCTVLYIQCKKILNNSAQGVWNI